MSLTRRTCSALLLCAPLVGAPLLAQAEATTQAEFRKAVALRPDHERGRELFEHCAACHGADGAGTTDGAIPRIAGQYRRVLVRQLVHYRRGTRWDARMEGVATSHQVIPELQDIADVAGFVSELQRDGKRGLGDGEHVQRGEAIYVRHCASCHGKTAEGSERKDIPRLSGQHAGYLARQIYDAIDDRRPLLTLTHRSRFETLEFEDILGLTDYLARIGWASQEEASAAPR